MRNSGQITKWSNFTTGQSAGVGDGGVRTSVSFLQERVVCQKNEIPAEQRPPQGVFFCGHAGRVINNFFEGAKTPQVV